MNEPKIITDAINALEAAERGPDHPRTLAREAIRKWRSNAEREALPVSNQHDTRGARVLDVNRALGHDGHDTRLGRK